MIAENPRKVRRTGTKSRLTKVDDLKQFSVIEKNSESNKNSSVMTKTRNPKVIINTEEIEEENCAYRQCPYYKHKFIISLCLIVI